MNTTAVDTLLPCPFCGGKATLGWESDAAAIGRTKRRVFCGFCGIRTVAYENDAIERWNTRTALQAAPEVVTVEDIVEALMTGSHGMLNFKYVWWAVDALFEKYPNGLRIEKEK